MGIKSLIAATATVAVLALGGAQPANAAGEAVVLPKQDWSFNGIFGTLDRAAAQRGLQVYREVCSTCHSLDYIAFRNLTDLGYSEDEVKAIAAQYEVQDGPNDEGEMYTRPGTPADRFPAPFANENAARASNGGALPPDLSLIVDARAGFEDYVYGVLTGYEEVPAGVTLMAGMNYNKYFPGHQIAMAQPLYADGVTYADGTKASVEQMAKDVTTFLAWASEPNMETRKQTGIAVILFLIVLSGLFYASKRKIWADVH
ncbi:cytochrome c1 [Nisaea sediminum]|uniref:cytochrome c1 n=1 Tax=Nisaea sediminum TaxID=2775867 RepID=UPI00186926BA|nr:cytochrome c1 [Nisaea sediminum]